MIGSLCVRHNRICFNTVTPGFLIFLLIPFLITGVAGALVVVGVVVAVLLRYYGRDRLSLYFLCVPTFTAAITLLFGWTRILSGGDILGFFIGAPIGAWGA